MVLRGRGKKGQCLESKKDRLREKKSLCTVPAAEVCSKKRRREKHNRKGSNEQPGRHGLKRKVVGPKLKR